MQDILRFLIKNAEKNFFFANKVSILYKPTNGPFEDF